MGKKRSILSRMKMATSMGAKNAYKFAKKNPKKALGYAVDGVRLLKELVNVEKKFIDSATSGTITTTPVVTLLTGVAQGNDYNNRNGDSIKLHGLSIKYYDAKSSAAAESIFGRLLIVLDKDSRQATPAYTDVMTSVSPAAHTNVDGHDRFVILADHMFTESEEERRAQVWEKYIPLDIHAKYNSTGDTVTSCAQNHIYAMFVTDQPTNGSAFVLNWRVSFYDN